MPSADFQSRARRLPSVSRIMESDPIQAALSSIPRSTMLAAVRESISDARSRLVADSLPSAAEIARDALLLARDRNQPSLRGAINATGVVLHTGLGRARLAESAQRAVALAASAHSTLEIDIDSGRRGSRQAHVADLLTGMTGAESSLVVNNNAGATLLGVAALAAGREVIVSRGELVEIGGSFRIPDIIWAGGAQLIEVGTTNRTRLSDYRAAISERTGLILRCHPSNFRIVGFTEQPDPKELAELGKSASVPVMEDLGSGALIDTSSFGAAPSATLRDSLESGFDLVTASGDKLLGGPQAGILVGKARYVEMAARNPLARALRIDKLSLAALEATLRLYADEATARREIPVLRYLGRTEEEIRELAAILADGICHHSRGTFTVDLVSESSQVGGGSLPGENLPTVCVRVTGVDDCMSADSIARGLRQSDPPVFARIKDDAVLLDPRTLDLDELSIVAEAVGRLTLGIAGKAG